MPGTERRGKKLERADNLTRHMPHDARTGIFQVVGSDILKVVLGLW